MRTAAWVFVAALSACDAGTTETDTPVDEVDATTGCDDAVECTRDSEGPGGCVHERSNAACAAGEICSATLDCIPSPVCAGDDACADDDACTADGCDRALATCTRAFLDRDGDGVPPVVCGGGDCDDGNPNRTMGLPEQCNGFDDDCDTTVDEGFDLTTRFDCGGCGVACADNENCIEGACTRCGATTGAACCEIADPPCLLGVCAPDGLCVDPCGEFAEPCCAFAPACAGELLCGRGVCSARSACGSATCDLVAGGCGAGEACRHDGVDYVCQPAASELPDACTRDEECPEAFRCGGTRCVPICCEATSAPDGCPPDTACGGGGPTGPTGECVAPCDPVANTGCTAGQTCRPIGAGARCTTMRRAGDRGAACALPGDCNPGLVCLPETMGASPTCQEVCRVGEAGCEAGERCERIDGSRTFALYGVCR